MMTTAKKQTSKQETCKPVQWIEDERIEVEGNGASQCLPTVKQGKETELPSKATMISNKINVTNSSMRLL